MEELFAYIFVIYIKLGHKNPSILTLCDSVAVSTSAFITALAFLSVTYIFVKQIVVTEFVKICDELVHRGVCQD